MLSYNLVGIFVILNYLICMYINSDLLHSKASNNV